MKLIPQPNLISSNLGVVSPHKMVGSFRPVTRVERNTLQTQLVVYTDFALFLMDIIQDCQFIWCSCGPLSHDGNVWLCKYMQYSTG